METLKRSYNLNIDYNVKINKDREYIQKKLFY